MAWLWSSLAVVVALIALLLIGLAVRVRFVMAALRSMEQAARDMGAAVGRILKLLWAVIIIIIGIVVIAVGLIMVVTPGPGILTILAGLAILGTELVWARRLMVRVRTAAGDLGDMTGVTQQIPPPNAGPIRRLVFKIGATVRWVADRTGISWLTRKLSQRIDRIRFDDQPPAPARPQGPRGVVQNPGNSSEPRP